MRIVMVSDQEAFGGAAVAASRLANGLHEAGHDVIRLVEQVDGSSHGWSTLRWEEQLGATHKILGKAGRKPRSLYRESAVRQLDRILGSLAPDVVNLHNLHSATGSGWSPRFVAAAARNAPVVWTLHDMWSFTGRCAYSYDCRKFLIGCDETCPTPFENPVLEPRLISDAWEMRRAMFADLPGIRAVAPSRWLAGEAASGFWGPERVSVIPYGLPLDIYRPLSRIEARRKLNLPEDIQLVLVVAQDFAARRKGLAVLENALGSIERRVGVLTLGARATLRTREDVPTYHLGQVNDPARIVLAMNAADLLVHPAIADNLPNAILEAMACGTPTVGFAVGGVPEMVRVGDTGWLAGDVSASSLAHSLAEALSDPGSLRDSCRRVAEAEFGEALQASRYERLFDEVLSASGTRSGTTKV